ncbi:GNAT family N-acetyltransferase [Olleya sp. Bg11-27]|uniref:GNAT family N-acetyltransferase n=1 Tax=Olleya sp. Bg11-27 TaxID=2058135 RepID=UPI000C310C23|nr:GNAT family N-acetyltransferase [Olleya sp. Bg11-27]AUC74860.1 GNAT family N-acetyltransferase [Olleya sp. Bg11-27]
MSIYIETERLLLREFEVQDVDGLFTLDSNPLVHKYLGNKPVTNKAQCLGYITTCKQKYKAHGICRLAVIEKQSGDFIGWSGLRLIDDYTFNNRTNFYDVGYRFIPKYWNKGYATESGKAAVNYGFETLKLDTIFGLTEIKNEASHNALLKIGLDYIEDFYYPEEAVQLRWYAIKNPNL